MELKQAFFILRHGSAEGSPRYLEAVKTIEENCVEVVRCKECKHRQDRLYCRLRGRPVIVANTDFCSYGERMSDNG